MYFYSYEVLFYDNMENKDCVAIGLLAGDSYEEAISKISGYYGDDNISQIKIEIISEGLIQLYDSSNDMEENCDFVKGLIAHIKEKVIW